MKQLQEYVHNLKQYEVKVLQLETSISLVD